jgi:hypothetical protein
MRIDVVVEEENGVKSCLKDGRYESIKDMIRAFCERGN